MKRLLMGLGSLVLFSVSAGAQEPERVPYLTYTEFTQSEAFPAKAVAADWLEFTLFRSNAAHGVEIDLGPAGANQIQLSDPKILTDDPRRITFTAQLKNPRRFNGMTARLTPSEMGINDSPVLQITAIGKDQKTKLPKITVTFKNPLQAGEIEEKVDSKTGRVVLIFKPIIRPDPLAKLIEGATPVRQNIQKGNVTYYDRGALYNADGSYFNAKECTQVTLPDGQTIVACYTAAHRTAPLDKDTPAFAVVVREDTGEKILVKIRDRGPYVDGNVLDLNVAGGKAFGIGHIGKVPATIYFFDAKLQPMLFQPPKYAVQLYSFKNAADAEAALEKVANDYKISSGLFVRQTKNFGETSYRLLFGPYEKNEDADKARDQWRSIDKKAFGKAIVAEIYDQEPEIVASSNREE